MDNNCFFADDVNQLNVQNAEKRKPFFLHTADSRLTNPIGSSNIGLRKLFNRSKFLFSFIFSFRKMVPMVL